MAVDVPNNEHKNAFFVAWKRLIVGWKLVTRKYIGSKHK